MGSIVLRLSSYVGKYVVVGKGVSAVIAGPRNGEATVGNALRIWRDFFFVTT